MSFITRNGSTATVGTSEYFIVSNSTTQVPQTNDADVEFAIDFSALTVTEQYTITVYDKVNGGTQAPVWQATVQGPWSQLYVTPMFRLGEGWECGVKKLSGTDRSLKTSYRASNADNATPTASLSTTTLDKVVGRGVFPCSLGSSADFFVQLDEGSLTTGTTNVSVSRPEERDFCVVSAGVRASVSIHFLALDVFMTVQAKDVGTAGNSLTIAVTAGSLINTGEIDDSAHPAIVVKYKAGTTTIRDVWNRLNESSYVRGLPAGETRTSALASGDAVTATSLASGANGYVVEAVVDTGTLDDNGNWYRVIVPSTFTCETYPGGPTASIAFQKGRYLFAVEGSSNDSRFAFVDMGTSAVQDVNVTQWNGAAVATPAVSGVPKVDVTDWLGSAPNALVSGRPDVSVGAMASGVVTATAVASAALTAVKFGNDVNIQVPRTATAQAGAATTITLDSSASATTDFYKGALVYIMSGTGANQAPRAITAYNGGTKVATVDRAWATNPDNTSVFQILLDENAASGIAAVNVTQWNGAAVATPAVSGVPKVDVTDWLGSAPNALVSGRPDVSVGAMASGVLTATAIASAAFTAAKFGNDVAVQATRTATAQTGSTGTTIKLDASASATDDLYKFQLVVILSGTGVGQARVISGYVGSTKIATVGRTWQTTPDNTSVFQIIPLDDAVADGAVTLAVNVSQWNGAAVATPAVSGVPKVDVTDWLGSAPNALVSGRVDTSVGAYQSGQAPLQPTVAGRTLDVSTGGEAGLDWANIGTPTTTVDLSGTSVKAIDAGGITLASFAADAKLQAFGIVRTATAQAGAASTITLDSFASTTDNLYNEEVVLIVSGTGANQCRTITGYVGSTKVATVDSAWAVNPDNTSVFVMFKGSASGGGSGPTASTIADAVWDEVRSGHVTSGTFGEGTNVVSIATAAANTVRDSLLTYAHRSGRTLRGFIRRMDALFFGQVTGLNGTTVTAYQPDGTTIEYTVAQDGGAGTRAAADVTTSETP